MLQVLQYGDAINLLDNLISTFGNRDVNPNITSQITIKFPLYLNRLKKGHSVDPGKTVLFKDETEEEFAERLKERERLKDMNSYSIRSTIERTITQTSCNKMKVSALIECVKEKIELHKFDTSGLLTPMDYTMLIIDLLRYGSSLDECFLCDKLIESPTHFFYGLGYEGDTTINKILSENHLLMNKKRKACDVLHELREQQPQQSEHRLLISLVETYNRKHSDAPINLYKDEPNTIIEKLTTESLLDHYYGAYIDTDSPAETINDYPPLSSAFLEHLEQNVVRPLEKAKKENGSISARFTALFTK